MGTGQGRLIVSGDEVADYVSERVESKIIMPYQALGVRENGRLIAGVVLNCWTGPDVEITVAGETRAFTRGFIRRVARYVWRELQAERISITTEQPEIVALAMRLGGSIEGVKRHAFGKGRHGTLVGIVKSEFSIR